MSRLEKLESLLQEAPTDSFILFAIAKEYEKMDSFTQAIEYYEKVRSNDAYYVGVYYHLGNAWAELDQKDKAIEIFKKGIEICKTLGDQHALSELKSVLMNIEIE